MTPSRWELARGVLLLTLFGACSPAGGTAGGEPPTARPGTPAEPATGPKSAPRWESVAQFAGSTSGETDIFTVDPGAIQWRARWTCQVGTLSITPDPPLRKGRPLTSGACTDGGEDSAIETGTRRLIVNAAGPWNISIDQQLESAADEPLLPEMATAPVVAEGDFYDIERTGKGRAQIYELPGGRRILRLDGFEVSQNADLFVWLSEAQNPVSSAEAVGAPHVQIAGLTATVGSQNYEIPPDIPSESIRSIVIWCTPIRVAYTAAALESR